jgi:hypothetical protein
VRAADGWSRQDPHLLAEDYQAGTNANFGSSTAVLGDMLVIGAPNAAAGAAYVFVPEAGVWGHGQDEIRAQGGKDGDKFGWSVGASQDTVVVGAPDEGAGAAYVFVRDGGGWSQQQRLSVDGGRPGDCFGCSVATSVDTIFIGAPRKSSYQGRVYVFVRDAGVWSQQKDSLSAEGPTNYDYWGTSIAMSGDSAFVGASHIAGDSGKGVGGVYVLARDDAGIWRHQQTLFADDGKLDDKFGRSVAVSGSVVVVGADQKNTDDSQAWGAGAAYLFVLDDAGTWYQQQKVVPEDGVDGGAFGNSVAVSGDTVVVGTESGSAYIYVLRPAPAPPDRSYYSCQAAPGGKEAYPALLVAVAGLALGARARRRHGARPGGRA